MTEGTERYDAVALTEAAERLGASLHAEAGWDATSVGVDVPAARLGQRSNCLPRCCSHPTFPATEVDRLRDERLNDLLRDPARVHPLDELVGIHAPAEPRHLDPLALLQGHARDVDVDQLAARQALGQDVPGDDRRGVASQREVGMLVVLLRDRECRAVVDDRFHRRADGARVRDVITEVGAVINAGRHQVEAVPEETEERDADGVGRGTVDGVGRRPVAEHPFAHPERPHQGLLVTDGALVGVGSHDRDVAHRFERLLEGEQPARLDAVVVRNEDPWPAGPLGHGSTGRSQRPRAAAGPTTGERLTTLLVEVPPF